MCRERNIFSQIFDTNLRKGFTTMKVIKIFQFALVTSRIFRKLLFPFITPKLVENESLECNIYVYFMQMKRSRIY